MVPGEIPELIDRLESVYGRTDWSPRLDPMEELVSCILSQHTNDRNSFAAFDRLRRAYPEWSLVVEAGPERVAEAVRSAGLANQKARSIISCLNVIDEATGTHNLDHLRELPDEEARAWLEALPGVGPKTAAIVLSFALGRDVVPVDTHVFRVSWRLGLVPKKAGEAKAHRLLDAVMPKGLAYRFHVALIRHGRETCKAPRPLCGRCPVTGLCDYYQAGPEPRTPTAEAQP